MKIKNVFYVLSLFLWMLIPKNGNSQTNMIFTGDTVRIKSRKYFVEPVTCIFNKINNDSLFFLAGNKEIAIPRSCILNIEVVRDKKSNCAKGALIGAAGTGVILGSVMAADAASDQTGWFVFKPGQAFAIGMGAGGLLGAVAGAVIGSGIKSDRWIKIDFNNAKFSERTVSKESEISGENKYKYSSGDKKFFWQVSFTIGSTSPGPAGDVEKAMINNGFDGTSPGGWFGGPVDHPNSKSGFGQTGIPWDLQIRFQVKKRFDMLFVTGNNPIGYTTGYNTDTRRYIFMNYYSFLISPVILYKFLQIAAVGMGPALNITKLDLQSGGETVESDKENKFGLVAAGMLSFPKKSRIFLNFNVQFRWIPSDKYGPFKNPYHTQGSTILNSFNADFSHLFIGLGLGFRIKR